MKKILSVLLIAMLVVVGCGKKGSSGSSSNSNSSGKNSSAPDTIASCPGCVYSNEKAQYHDGYYYDELRYERSKLDKSQYTTDWKKAASESLHDIFFGYVLDKDNRVTNGYVCAVYNDIPFCLEGTSDNDDFVTSEEREEIYNKNKTVLKELFDVELGYGDYYGNKVKLESGDQVISISYMSDVGTIAISPGYFDHFCRYGAEFGKTVVFNKECK